MRKMFTWSSKSQLCKLARYMDAVHNLFFLFLFFSCFDRIRFCFTSANLSQSSQPSERTLFQSTKAFSIRNCVLNFISPLQQHFFEIRRRGWLEIDEIFQQTNTDFIISLEKAKAALCKRRENEKFEIENRLQNTKQNFSRFSFD